MKGHEFEVKDTRTKDDEILRHAGMNNVHGAHRAARIVKHPVLLEVDIPRHLFVELVDNVPDDAARVVAVPGYAPLREVVQVVRLEDVEALQVLVEDVDDRGEERREEGQDGEEAGYARRRGGGGFRSGHGWISSQGLGSYFLLFEKKKKGSCCTFLIMSEPRM